MSAKSGKNCAAVLQAVIDHIPPPTGDPGNKLQALIFDAEYNDYRGVVIYLRLMQGTITRGFASPTARPLEHPSR